MTRPLKDDAELIATLARWFDVFDIAPILAKVSWPLDDCLRRVTHKGRGSRIRQTLTGDGGTSLNPNGVLQLCLLWCTPADETPVFSRHDTAAGMYLQNPGRGPGKAVYACPDQPVLVETLAEALWAYQRELHRLDEPFRRMSAELPYHIDAVRIAIEHSVVLRRREELSPASPIKGLHRNTIDDFDRILAGLAPSLDTDAYQRGMLGKRTRARRTEIENDLLRQMQEAFRTHGPRNFPKSAVIYAIAEIWRRLSIVDEDRPLEDVFGQLQQRLRRSYR